MALSQPRKNPADLEAGRVLDTQIEAQVHGRIGLHHDVELLVADPAFAPTPTGAILRELVSRYEIPLHWHRGFRLPVRDVQTISVDRRYPGWHSVSGG